MSDRIPQSVVDRLWREWRVMDDALPRPVPVPMQVPPQNRWLKIKRLD